MELCRRKIRKSIAILTTAFLLFGLFWTLPGNEFTVHAADNNKPSVTSYATKQELMDTFLQDGNNTTIGKLVFGKNCKDQPMEWYILGKDSGVSGDNIAIFAAGAIAEKRMFDGDISTDKTFDPSFGVYK